MPDFQLQLLLVRADGMQVRALENAGSFAVNSGLSARQSQLILVENCAECRSVRF